MRYPTIKEIAKIAKVSANTVSCALRGKEGVSKETKAKILKVAKEIGYEKNYPASNLRTNSNRIIGVIIIDNSNPFYAEVLMGIENEARKNGYNILIYNTHSSPEEETKAIKIMLSHRVEGIVIDPLNQIESRNIEYLLKKKIPFVQASHYSPWKANWVGYDDYQAGYIATENFIKKGYRQIAIFAGCNGDSTYEDRLKGFRAALSDYGLAFLQKMVINCLPDFNNAYAKMKEVLKQDRLMFNAVFAYNDISALGLMKAIKDSGLSIPGDIAVCGVDDLFFTEMIEPSLTTVSLPKYQAGTKAVEVLLEQIKADNQLFKMIKLPVKLISRNSV